MMSSLKAEFRKLLTIRSTYFMIFIAMLLITIYTFWFEGYKGNTGSDASLLTPNALQEILSNAAGVGSLFICIIAVLFMAHEYRYNMIMYTLTANAQRTKVLLTKLIAISIFGVTVGIVFVLYALGCYLLGLELRNAVLVPQDIKWVSELSKVAFYYFGYSVIGLILAALMRNVVGSISVLFLASTMIEPLLSIVLKDNAKYLPFTALDSVVKASFMPNTLSTGDAMVASSIYLAIGMLVSWLLFIRRDAN
jgi:ABC-2 type transport system permease protein